MLAIDPQPAASVACMPTLTIRNIDSDLQLKLKRKAAANNRSMEAEAREILRQAIDPQSFGSTLVTAFRDLGGADLEWSRRSQPRRIDLH